MFRWARRIITLFSLILFVASATMCSRSFRKVDFVYHQRIERSAYALILKQRVFVSGRGGVCVGTRRTTWPLPHPEMTEEHISTLRSGFGHEHLATAGYGGDLFKGTRQPMKFGFGRGQLQSTVDGVTVTGRLIIFPWGAALLALAILPFIGTVRLITAHRRRRRLAALNYNGMQTRKLAA